MELKQLHLPALIITALLSLLDGAGVVNTVLVKQGGSATLKCPLTLPVEGSSAPMQVVEWVRQGYDIPILIKFGAHSLRVHPKYEGRVSLFGSTSLKMKGLVLEDNGWYECRILQLDKSSDEGRNGTWTLLSVTAPPVFSETPPPVTEALLGKPVTLKCVARGNPLPTIKWYKDGVQIIQSNGVTVVNGSLIFKSASRSTAGQYQCRASNSEGNEIHIMQLRVKGSPVILNPPTDTVLNMSQNALLRCKAEADPPNMTYVWMKGEENVYHTESMKSRVKVMVDGTLLISHLIPGDSGNYTCMPTNGLPSPPTASAVLTVRHPAQVTKMPKRIFLPTGLRGVISCPLVAEPPLLRVEWTKNGKPLDPNAYPGWSLTADGSIIITTANDDVVGVYTCTPYNSYGTMGQSERTMVLLQDPPSLRIAPDKEYREEAGTALFIPCRASGDPQPTVTWTKFGPSVSISDYSVSVDGSLLLSPLSKEHHGEWECSVTNGVSSITTTTSVTVLGTSPHAVSSVSVEVGANQANVSWVPGFDGGYAQTFTVWLKCVCTEDEHQEWRLFPNSTSSTSLLVTGLLPSTKYQFNVMAQNKLGSGPYSEHTTATTMDPTPTPFRLEPPTQLSVNQSSEVLYLRWMVPSPEESPVDGFILQSRQEEGKWSNLDEDISVDKSEVLVQGLQKNCNYELRLLSRRGEQLSVPSRSINVSTLVAVLDGLSPGFRLPENVPLPLWIGVMAGMGVLCFILLLALVTVCLIGRRRIWRRRKTQDDHPDANMKNDSAPDSPDSVLKEKLLPLRPLSSSSSSSDHSCLDRSSQNDGQREHLLPRTHAPSHGSVCENHLRRSSTMDVIHRGPDGRFVLESQEEDSAELQDIPQSSKPVSNATLRKSQSLRSYRSDRRDPPFVVSVDMPPCGLDISASGRTRTLPNRGCYSVSLGQEISDRSSFCSEISGSVLYAPSDTYSTIKCGGPNVRASTLVLQMEHEREQGNLSRCLRLAREREELEQELRKWLA
ncbi:protein turtle homolog A [Trichomycterus rosablanca]|uniref:protein turtle homolog A n=1 Tax=Trichomycterus rosablanca TaxID=2290929 RepID=UPI002F357987